MPKPSPSGRHAQHQVSTISTRPWQVLKKRLGQLITASVLLLVWIVFLVAMAVYN